MENKLSMKMSVAIVVGLIILAFWGRFNAMKNGTLEKPLPIVNSFEECAALYPVMESYPEQCNTPDGKHFTNPVQFIEGAQVQPLEMSVKNMADGIIKGKVSSSVVGIERNVVVYSYEKWNEKERAEINPDGTFEIYIEPGAYYVMVEPGTDREEAEAIFIQGEQTITLDFNI